MPAPYTTGHDPNKATDSPDLGGFMGFGSWDWHDYITWHKALLAAYGEQKAHDLWIAGWEAQSFWDWDYSWAKYDNEFHDYVKKYHLDASNWIADVFDTAAATVHNVLDTVETSGKVVKWGVPIMVGGVLLVLTLSFISTGRKAMEPSPANNNGQGRNGKGQFVKK